MCAAGAIFFNMKRGTHMSFVILVQNQNWEKKKQTCTETDSDDDDMTIGEMIRTAPKMEVCKEIDSRKR